MTNETLATLRNEAKEGLRERVTLSDEARAVYEQRIDAELGRLGQLGFTDPFVNVRDLLTECRRSGIRVGISRGVLTVSLVAFALGMSDVDPVAHGFFFERFINPSRPGAFYLYMSVSPLQWNALIDLMRARLASGSLDPHLDIACYADKTLGAVVAREPNWPESGSFPTPYGMISDERVQAAVESIKDVSLPGLRDAELTVLYMARPRTFEEFASAAIMSQSTGRRRVRVAEFVQRRDANGNGTHQAVDAILSPTRGLLTFQEQATQLAMAVGGLNIFEAERLRRAFCVHEKSIVEGLREPFANGAATQGIDRAVATEVFEMLAKDVCFAFSKTGAVGFGLTILALLNLRLSRSDWWDICDQADKWPNASARAEVFRGTIETK